MVSVLDRSLPHGRAWVAARGCGCAECGAARERLRVEAEAVDRAEGTGVLAPAGQAKLDAWRRPRWTKFRHGWAVTEPPGESFRQGQVVNVVNHTTGVTRERRLVCLLGSKAVEPGLELRVWQPAR